MFSLSWQNSILYAKELKLNELKLDMPDFSKLKDMGGKPTDQNPKSLPKKVRDNILEKSKNTGYYGTLPNIEREFEYIKQVSKKTTPANKYRDGFIDEENLQKTPMEDDLFLDIILKKEKQSDYTKAVLKFVPILEKFKTCIQQQCDIQRFNANVNLVDLYARRLQKDYGETQDANENSFYLIQNISYLAKIQGNLKYEANFYSKYMPLTGSIYSKENIETKDYELLIEIDKTIFELQRLK